MQAIDPATGNVDAPLKVGNNPSALVYDGARLWAAKYLNGTMQAIDPATGEVGAPLKIGSGPIALAYDGARMWIANRQSNSVQYIVVHKHVNK